jgi:hypothetical protein
MLSRLERAKQFLPFDSLKGLQIALREKEVEYVDKMELSDEQKEDISEKLQLLGNGENISITYYFNMKYNKIEGRVLYVNPIKKVINVSKIEIPFVNISSIDIL